MSSLLQIRIADTDYVLPLLAVREVSPLCADDVTPVPGSLAFICGIVNLRGKIVTLVDLPAFLATGQVPTGRGDAASSATAGAEAGRGVGLRPLAVVLDSANLAIGILADEVAAVWSEAEAHAAEIEATSSPLVPRLLRLAALPDRLLSQLEPPRLLESLCKSHQRRAGAA